MDQETRELVCRLFAEATARLEVAHAHALAGQSSKLDREEYAADARKLNRMALGVSKIATAIALLLNEPKD